MPGNWSPGSTLPAPVLVLGVDAMESSLIAKWSRAGHLPNIRRIQEQGFSLQLKNRVRLFPDTIWFELTTGCSWQKTGCYFATAQLHPGETWLRPVDGHILSQLPFFWKTADRAGRSVLVVDHPHAVLVPGFGGVHVQGFNLHHPDWTRASIPESEYGDQRTRLGPEPVGRLYTGYSSSLSEHRRLQKALLRSIRQKEQLVASYLRTRRLDLVFATFTEAHTAGHSFWHLHDPGHPLHPGGDNGESREFLRSVYTAIDTSIGKLLEHLPPESRVLVVAGHGMQGLSGGWEILPELLVRLGLSPNRPIRHGLSKMIKPNVKRALGRFFPQTLKRRYHLGLNAMVWSFADSAIQAVAIPNAFIGAIRLNLRGRDPRGTVEPGAGADSVMDRIETALAELRCVKTGQPVVAAVIRTGRDLGPRIPQGFPDMVVQFRDEIIPLDACQSQRVGVLTRLSASIRTGEHTDHACLLGKGFSVKGDSADVLDLSPSVLDLLGISPGQPLDGRSFVGDGGWGMGCG